jgi:hypothetical protein
VSTAKYCPHDHDSKLIALFNHAGLYDETEEGLKLFDKKGVEIATFSKVHPEAPRPLEEEDH